MFQRPRQPGEKRKGVALALLGALWMSLSPAPSRAESACDEPEDPAYAERMARVAEAVEAADYEAALAHLDWALQHYDYAVLVYSRARALHHLGRLLEAEAAYNTFIRLYRDCPDPERLIPTARDYRSLAVQEQAQRLRQETAEGSSTEASGGEGGTDSAMASVENGSAEGAAPGADGEAGEGGSFDPGWLVLGGGAALVLSGVIFDLANAHLLDEKEEAEDARDLERLSAIEEDIEDARTVDLILYGTGIVAVAVGLALLLTGGGETEQAESSVLGLAPGPAGRLLTGRIVW
jgi:tetratricopeptide (TPR) repeat protein